MFKNDGPFLRENMNILNLSRLSFKCTVLTQSNQKYNNNSNKSSLFTEHTYTITQHTKKDTKSYSKMAKFSRADLQLQHLNILKGTSEQAR